MSTLAEHIVAQLAEIDEIEVTEEQIQTHIDSFEEPKPTKAKGKAVSKTPAKGKAPAKGAKKSSPAEDEEAHTCGYSVNGKDGVYICKKNALNELDGLWYCGTDKSGHYKSAVAKAAPKSKTPKGTAKGASKGKAAKVVQKVVKKERIDLKEFPKKGSGKWVDLKHLRMVYCKEPLEVYGVLDEDDETILPMTDEAIEFAEAHNISIRATKAKAKGKAVAKGKAKTPAKTLASKAAPKAKTPAPKGKATPKAKTPVSKATPKGKAKKAEPTPEDEEELDELREDAVEVEVEEEEEPEVGEGEAEDEEQEEEVAEIDLGEDGAEDVEDVEDDDAPDVEEADEGEAADDAGDEEEEGEADGGEDEE